MKKKLYLLLMLAMVFFASCRKDSNTEGPKAMDELKVPEGFKFEMMGNSDIRIVVKDFQNNPIPGVRLEVYRDYNEQTDEGTLLVTGMTDAQGKFETVYPLASVADSVYVVTPYVGMPRKTAVRVTNGRIDALIGGAPTEPVFKSGESYKDFMATGYKTLCSYNSQGVPSCLIFPRDIITAELLEDINNALPERMPVPQYNPQYLANGNQTDLRLLEDADVWLTFVHEGAGFKNTIGYYKYNISNPPQRKEDIDTIYIAFPNLSYYNSGGGLRSGDKVKLGTFPAGTGIGWVLIADGFQNNVLNTNKTHFYSNPAFNPEPLPSQKQHNVVLYDPERKLFLIGFEDLDRRGGDNDFNDAIFYATSNPITAISFSNMPLLDPNLIDTDGDGAVDAMDDYPTDPLLAFNNYYPGRNKVGGLSFEDLWPTKGDYDFNDLVVSYNINQITNGQNKPAEIRATFTVEAIGAGYKNGFGFQLDNIAPSVVQSVTGSSLQEGYITLSSNGTESGQQNAVIIVMDNVYNPFKPQITSGYVNTRTDRPFVEPKTINLTVKLNASAIGSAFPLPPYNPFIIVNKDRGKEVHLPGYRPTNKVNTALFGTADDDTKPASGKYYQSKTNLPWGMHTPVRFDYPIEREPVISGYLRFDDWVESAGVTYGDWYTDKVGYRDNTKLYQRSAR